MSLDEKIVSAVQKTVQEVWPFMYTGKATEYAVYNYNIYPRVFAASKPDVNVYSCQVHLYCPLRENARGKIKAINQALSAAGCTWPNVINASDSESQHWVFEFESTDGEL